MRIDNPRKVLFLATPEQVHNDNHVRLPRYFTERNWQVDVHQHNDISLERAANADTSYNSSARIQLVVKNKALTNYDLIWPIGFGPATTFADRADLIQFLPEQKLITSSAALNTLHGKAPWLKFAPRSFVSSNLTVLAAHVARLGGEWILKPNSGSHGRDVIRVRSAQDVVEVASDVPKYWLLQEYIPAIKNGETRTLVCAGTLLGSYLRTPNAEGMTNLALGATAQQTNLSAEDKNLVMAVLEKLNQAGVGFAAIDTAGGYLIETNIANPGGLQTLAELAEISDCTTQDTCAQGNNNQDKNLGDRLLQAINARYGQN